MTDTTKRRTPGAGRPRLGVGRTVRKAVTIAPEDVAFLKLRYGTDNLSDAVRGAVRELRETKGDLHTTMLNGVIDTLKIENADLRRQLAELRTTAHSPA